MDADALDGHRLQPRRGTIGPAEDVNWRELRADTRDQLPDHLLAAGHRLPREARQRWMRDCVPQTLRTLRSAPQLYWAEATPPLSVRRHAQRMCASIWRSG